jgi:CHAD domain-containing protein
MSQELLSSAPSRATIPSGKWIKGVSSGQPVGKAARRILEERLHAVWHWLPLAAERSEEDVEYVHQLRIASRRDVESLRLFSDLIPDEIYQDFRDKLRQIRVAADEARNWDVLSDIFLDCPDVPGGGAVSMVVEEIKARRREAQQPILAIYRGLPAAQFDQQIESLLEAVESGRHGAATGNFGRHARRQFRAVVKRFLKASEANLSDDEALHNLRIRTKKLRYTMEMVAACFKPSFRKRLYARISGLQDIMGIVNDHATGKTFFHDWSLKVQDAQEKAFLEGVVLAEARAHRDLRQAFLAIWTDKTVAELRRQFNLYCDLY